MSGTDMLLWLDIETTGVDPVRDSLLEISAMLTDMTGEKTGEEYHSLVKPRFWRHVRENLSAWAYETHTANNLIHELDHTGSDDCSWPTVMDTFDQWIRRLTTDHVLHPTGFSIHFDVDFLSRRMPETMRRLSHRQVDVSSLILTMESINPDIIQQIHASTGTTDHRSDTCLNVEWKTYKLIRTLLERNMK
ncbi:hypothetical protein KIH77_08735 [Bifidobacterium sp. 82T24]|uniref:exonuclease domain-containing protein n=1 Tax=Bifidobacterium pluvialisilvae TaxID=2834436 RepID=UPI001C57B0C9|nr:exonuclease domain-containing protein [Bifidobacterium pluvialisilvae]MBW3088807.1 hypothetical protein [Bifidobacterium pluvialisilvae]